MTMELVVLGLAIFYVFLSPYNKVEESFNTQATHDILYHGINLKYVSIIMLKVAAKSKVVILIFENFILSLFLLSFILSY